MKKILTLAAVIAATTFSYGQRMVDIEVTDIIEPDTLNSTASGSDFIWNAVVSNTGPDDLMAGDSIFYHMFIIIGQQAIVDPSNAPQGGVKMGFVLQRDVVAGDTFHFVQAQRVTQVINPTGQVQLRLLVIAKNADLPFEETATLTNNTRTETRVWYNVDRFPLSIADMDKSAVNAYPNPAADRITLSSNIVSATDNSVISVYDAQGKMVYTNTIQAGTFNNTEVNTQNFKNGVYIYRIQSGDQQFSGKFIVQH